MEIAELIFKFIDSLKYPFIIFVFGLLFRKEISGILKGNFKAKYKDLELSVERSRKTIENLRENQEIVKSKISEIIEESTSDEKSSSIEKLNVLLNSMEESLDYWESELISALRKNGGRFPEEEILFYYFDVIDDPWHRSRDGGHLLKAISTLLEKSIVMRDGKDLVLHPSLIAK